MYLHRTAAELMSRSVLALPISTPIWELKRWNLPHFVVVLDEYAQPVAVILNTPLARTLQQIPVLGESLAALRSHFLMPTVTTVATPVTAILQGVAHDRTARWHVVMDGDSVAGILTPETLYAELSLHPEHHARFVVVRSPGVYGPVQAPPGTFFKCRRGHRFYFFQFDEVRKRLWWNGEKLKCRFDGELLIEYHT